METTKNDIKKLTEYIKEEGKDIDIDKLMKNAEQNPEMK